MLTRWARVPAESVELPDDEHVVLPQGPQAAVEPRPVVADAGREVVVDVDCVDAGRPQGVALQVQRLRENGTENRPTSRQRSALFALPQREADLLRHYTLSDEDLQNIGARRRPRNKLGFALQLCVLRHPGRLLAPGEFVPPAVVGFIGRQLDLDGDELADYAVRSETRHEHLAELRRL